MHSCRCLLILFLTLLLPDMAKATESLQSDVAKILRLKLPPEEIADSAHKVILRFDEEERNRSDRSAHEESEATLAEMVLPYALKNGVSDSMIAFIYDEIGRLQMSQGRERKAEAEASFRKGIPYAEKAQDWFKLGRLLEHLGFAEIKHGDRAKGFEFANQAIDAYRRSDVDADRYISRCYYMQAAVYLQIVDIDGLAKVVSGMEKFASSVKEENKAFHLYNLYSVQEVYFANLKNQATDPALRRKYADTLDKVSLRTLALIESAPDEWRATSINPTWNYFNRASMFVNEYDRPPMDSVIYYCDKALGVSHRNQKDENLEALTSTTMVIAEGWMKNGDYAKAGSILGETLQHLNAQKDVNNLVEERVQIFELFRDIAAHFGRMDEALAYADSVRKLEKERFSIERASAVKDLEVKYKTQETQLALAQSESKRANTLMWLFAALGLILMGAICFVVYAGRQRRRRLQKEVEFTKLRADISRQLTQQYVEGLESERKRMARELHDGVCNDLLAIRMGMKAGNADEGTAKLLDECRESVRRISHELMPPEFAYASLDEVVRFFVMKQADANAGKITISYVSSAEGRSWAGVPDSVSLEIYRIVQEAVGNAIKHSGCSEIDVSMMIEGEELILKVADNGHFLITRDKGFGLHSIKKRAEAIGAVLRIDRKGNEESPEHSHGTVLSLKLRLK